MKMISVTILIIIDCSFFLPIIICILYVIIKIRFTIHLARNFLHIYFNSLKYQNSGILVTFSIFGFIRLIYYYYDATDWLRFYEIAKL